MLHFKPTWYALGPFAIGTREDPWHDSVDIQSLEVSQDSFPSTLAGQARWEPIEMDLLELGERSTKIRIPLVYPEVNWSELVKTFGWAATQFDAWLRGELEIEKDCTLALNVRNSPEYILDGVRYEGDIYDLEEYLTIPLNAGKHRLDIRVITEIRIFGFKSEPAASILVRAVSCLDSDRGADPLDGCIQLPDILQNPAGEISYSSCHCNVTISNYSGTTKIVQAVDDYVSVPEFTYGKPVRLQPYQTRQWPIQLPPISTFSLIRINWHEEHSSSESGYLELQAVPAPHCFHVVEISQPHIISYLNHDGSLGRAVLRAPRCSTIEQCPQLERPVIVALHGAGVDIDNPFWKNAFAEFYKDAWIIQPDCGKWGDDWHSRSALSIECALKAIPDWIRRHTWHGPGASLDKILIMGHSNGGQGAMQFIVRNADRLIGAAFAAGYSSIARYVPYSFWTSNASSLADRPEYDVVRNIEMFRGVKCFIKHGMDDDNVPLYHSQLIASLDQTIEFEQVPGMGHYWDQILTEGRIQEFVENRLTECEINRPDVFTVLSWGRPIQKGGFIINSVDVSAQLPARMEIDQCTSGIDPRATLKITTHGVTDWTCIEADTYRHITNLELNGVSMGSFAEFLRQKRKPVTVERRDLTRILESRGPISIANRDPNLFTGKNAFENRIAHSMLLYHAIDCEILESEDLIPAINNAIILESSQNPHDTGIELTQDGERAIATLRADTVENMSKLIRLLPWRTGTGVPGRFKINMQGRTTSLIESSDVDFFLD